MINAFYYSLIFIHSFWVRQSGPYQQTETNRESIEKHTNQTQKRTDNIMCIIIIIIINYSNVSLFLLTLCWALIKRLNSAH